MAWASHLVAGTDHLAEPATLRLSLYVHGPSICLSIPNPVSLSLLHPSLRLSFLITSHDSQCLSVHSHYCIISLSALITPMSELPYFPSGSLSIPISLVSVCPSIPIYLYLPVHPLCSNQMCCPCRMAIAQHLPCLGLLLGVSGQRTGPYTSYRSTHRSTLSSSHTSDLSWISRRRRQASLGSESDVVRMLGPPWLAIPSSARLVSGLWTGLLLRLRDPQDPGMLEGRAPPNLPMAFPCIILPDR